MADVSSACVIGRSAKSMAREHVRHTSPGSGTQAQRSCHRKKDGELTRSMVLFAALVSEAASAEGSIPRRERKSAAKHRVADTMTG